MTPEIDKLEAKKNETYAVKIAADADARKAAAAYEGAVNQHMLDLFAAQGGVVGATRVRKVRSDGTPDMRSGPFAVTGARIAWRDPVYTLRAFNKDGSLSRRATREVAEKIVILPADQPE